MFTIQFDVTYLDGNLAGLLIPGQTVTYPDRNSFDRALRFYVQVARDGDFIRAVVTGNRYTVSNVQASVS